MTLPCSLEGDSKEAANSFLSGLFPTRQVGIQLKEGEINSEQLDERADAILKMQMDPSYAFERVVLQQQLKSLKAGLDDGVNLINVLNICEMTQDWQFAIHSLIKHCRLGQFVECLSKGNN